MNVRRNLLKSALAAVFSSALLLAAMPASAHCDGLDGPVVTAAHQALDSRDVNRVLIWVKPAGEREIRDAFAKALAKRDAGPAAKERADHAFYEAVVRVHRAGEGEKYTGLKPAGRDLGPAIPAADRAIDGGSVKPVIELLTHSVHEGIERRYEKMMALRDFKPGDVAAGQEYVAAYVAYIHAVEKVHEAAAGEGHGHGASQGAEAHRH